MLAFYRDCPDVVLALAKTQARIVEVEKDLEHLKQCRFGGSDVEEAVSDFDRLWTILRAKERVQLMELLVSRVPYDRFEGALTPATNIPKFQSSESTSPSLLKILRP
ncbi:MAG: hypothetical protein ACK5YR_01075 [Pirellula sp.]